VSCSYQAGEFGSDMTVKTARRQFAVSLAAAGVHNVRNALAAIACTLAIGIDPDVIARGLETFLPVSGRLQRKTTTAGMLVIDDTYNANPDSVRAAIDVLSSATAPRILVLGDMGEVGNQGHAFHEEIGNYARSRGIEYVLTLGDLAHHTGRAFGARAKHYDDVESLNQALAALITPAATVLVKGSRFMKMERVVQYLLGSPLQESH
jgi:UDP-N-acetylmuramoyl-tripeptide--D-alanyl-D-alanine ligase